jgi:hypothetical protein
LIDPNVFFRMGTPPHMVEILTRISGVEFDQAWAHRMEAVIDESTGLKAFVISADDLIANKTAFGRPYDLADADAVQTAQRLRPAKNLPNRLRAKLQSLCPAWKGHGFIRAVKDRKIDGALAPEGTPSLLLL